MPETSKSHPSKKGCRSGPANWADWGKAASYATKTRKIADDTQKALSGVLNECSTEPRTSSEATVSTSRYSKCCDLRATPDYRKIYENLANLTSARSMQRLGGYENFFISKWKLIALFRSNVCSRLEAAILLNIFDEMEKDIDEKCGPQVEIFKRIFQNFKSFDSSEFRLHTPISQENAADVVMNLFNLPKDYLDFSDAEPIKKE